MFDDAESTVMSILQGVANGQHSRRQVSLQRFCLTYTQPLVNYLVKAKRLHEDHAADLVQDFWLSKMLKPAPDGNLVAKYLVAQKSRESSSFRSYLSVSLNNFLRSKYRSADASMRQLQLSVDQLEGWEVPSPEDLDQFDLEWANHVLVVALERVRQECDSEKLRFKWEVFTKLILRPYATYQSRPSYAALADELGLQNPKEIGTSLTTFKRIFMRHLQIAVQDYLPADSREESIAEAQGEVAILLAKLSKVGGLQLPLAKWGVANRPDHSACSLNLNNLMLASLIQSDEDHQTAWANLRKLNLFDILEIRVDNSTTVTVACLVAGEIRDVRELNQIRSSAKRLGSGAGVEEATAPRLNRKIYGLIYLIAIASAKEFLNENISNQSDSQLATLAESFVGENWIDESTKQLLNRYRARLIGRRI